MRHPVLPAIGTFALGAAAASCAVLAFTSRGDAGQPAPAISAPAPKVHHPIPVGLQADLPAARIVMMFGEQCAIQEVAEAKPWAVGGKEYLPNGDYWQVCLWVLDGQQYVIRQDGRVRVLAIDAFRPIEQ